MSVELVVDSDELDAAKAPVTAASATRAPLDHMMDSTKAKD